MEESAEGHGDINVRIVELLSAYGRDICWLNGYKTLLRYLFI